MKTFQNILTWLVFIIALVTIYVICFDLIIQ